MEAGDMADDYYDDELEPRERPKRKKKKGKGVVVVRIIIILLANFIVEKIIHIETIYLTISHAFLILEDSITELLIRQLIL